MIPLSSPSNFLASLPSQLQIKFHTTQNVQATGNVKANKCWNTANKISMCRLARYDCLYTIDNRNGSLGKGVDCQSVSRAVRKRHHRVASTLNDSRTSVSQSHQMVCGASRLAKTIRASIEQSNTIEAWRNDGTKTIMPSESSAWTLHQLSLFSPKWAFFQGERKT